MDLHRERLQRSVVLFRRGMGGVRIITYRRIGDLFLDLIYVIQVDPVLIALRGHVVLRAPVISGEGFQSVKGLATEPQIVTQAVLPFFRVDLIAVKKGQFGIGILFIPFISVILEQALPVAHLKVDIFFRSDRIRKININNEVRALDLGHGNGRYAHFGVIVDIVAPINAFALTERRGKAVNIAHRRHVAVVAEKSAENVKAILAVFFHEPRRNGDRRGDDHAVFALSVVNLCAAHVG